MLTEFFPLGYQHYVIGGLLIGLGTGLIYLFTGIYGGASSFFTTTLSYFTKDRFFSSKQNVEVRFRKLLFSVGLILGGVLFVFFFNDGQMFVTQVQWWRLLIGGFLVGLGTRLGRGCTSGHGICGLSAWSGPSLAAVVTFMAVAIGVAHIVQIIGVLP